MKKLFVSCLFLCFLFSITVCAHPGRTDGDGGHYDHQNGGYHYHHGYSAHSHIDGVCPYDYDDQTDHSTNTNDSNNLYNYKNDTKYKVETSKPTSSKQSIGSIISPIVITLFESIIIFFLLDFLLMAIVNKVIPNISDKVLIVLVILMGIVSIIVAVKTDFIF